ncbi:MAG: phenylalanine--tRNA ligase subunit alpha [Elusimicrobiota bacterium]
MTLTELLEIIEKTAVEAEREITDTQNLETLERIKNKYLSRQGAVAQLFQQLGVVPNEDRPAAGKNINELKLKLEDGWKKRKVELDSGGSSNIAGGRIQADYTLPGKDLPHGHEHVLTKTVNKMIDVFKYLGFNVADGPEIEDEYHNFEALNIPSTHPARDMQDTFYVHSFTEKDKCVDPLTRPAHLLRTHTSPVQIRVMKNSIPPLRVICPGRVYRHDEIDASHSTVFHQVEGLAVGEKITFAQLKGVLTAFIKTFFGDNTKARFRPSYFPFVEPGAEVDMTCPFCKGPGCNVCKYSGYVEILGAGMVHPNVFKAVGYDVKKYTGYAFGIGVERVAMLKYNINDMRLFYENDLRFINQF